MKPVWIIQENLTSEVHKWDSALRENGSDFRHITIVPFADDLPDIELPVGKPIVVHGSTTLIKNYWKKGWEPGAFFHPDHFRPSLWQKIYGHNFLNYDGTLMKLAEVDVPCFGEFAFIRPDGDFKDFSGSVVDRDGLDKFVKSIQQGGFTFDDQLKVFVSKTREIVEEYRMFIVDGQVVSASKYRLRTILDPKPGAPQEIIDFANKMAKIWSPEQAYVMDICNLVSGELKVIELNCFNASGVYKAPLIPVIQAVEALF